VCSSGEPACCDKSQYVVGARSESGPASCKPPRRHAGRAQQTSGDKVPYLMLAVCPRSFMSLRSVRGSVMRMQASGAPLATTLPSPLIASEYTESFSPGAGWGWYSCVWRQWKGHRQASRVAKQSGSVIVVGTV